MDPPSADSEDSSSGGPSGSDTDWEPICGDGIVDPEEECDDGGPSATCDADCTQAVCGDGLANAEAGEECDDGDESATCDADCTQAVCGDGLANAEAGEECDDGGPSATCDADCTQAVCGDGLANGEAGELCDDVGPSTECDSDCTEVVCGDGLANAVAGEECDDEGESAACDADCTQAACGDGLVNVAADEQCDDGGKSAACDVDCTPAECGDAVFNALAGEECDAGGSTAACDDDCTTAECGDGYLNTEAGEDCDDAGESTICNSDCSLSVCGDGITNASAEEDCDDAGESAACDDDCTVAVCGDGQANQTSGEDCDELDLRGTQCADLGFYSGPLSCSGCTFDSSACSFDLAEPVLNVALTPIKEFEFSWALVVGADHYQLFESVASGEPFVQLGPDIVGTSASTMVPLYLRYDASYYLRACNMAGCVDSPPVDIMGSMVGAVGYIKASTPDQDDSFGRDLALSADGTTLVVAAYSEGSNSIGIDGDQANNGAGDSGAAYVYVRDEMGAWTQQAYIKASNTDVNDEFGSSIALSADGNTIAIGAHLEDSNATGINGDDMNDGQLNSGAVYVFTRDGMGAWSQQAYIKGSNTDGLDDFGYSTALSDDGNTLAVGAFRQSGDATGVNGAQTTNGASFSGATYVFTRDGMGAWSQQAYIKATNTENSDEFGRALALSGDGDTLAVTAPSEDSSATGINGDQLDNATAGSGALYMYVRDEMGTWSHQAYIKASNTDEYDRFGDRVDLNYDGSVMAVGAIDEDSNATGIGGDQLNNSSVHSGAVYLFERDDMETWSQQAYVKASNNGILDEFGWRLGLTSDGNMLVVGAVAEDSSAVGINGDPASNGSSGSGAVYVYRREPAGPWSEHAYIKAIISDNGDHFASVAVSGEGQTIAVGAYGESSSSTGVGGDPNNNGIDESGAVYLY